MRIVLGAWVVVLCACGARDALLPTTDDGGGSVGGSSEGGAGDGGAGTGGTGEGGQAGQPPVCASPACTQSWVQFFDEPFNVTWAPGAFAVAADPCGNVSFTAGGINGGFTLRQLGPDGDLRWSRELWQRQDGFLETFPVLAGDAWGNVIVAGAYTTRFTIDGVTLAPVDGKDIAILKFDDTGALVFAHAFGTRHHESVTTIDVDEDGNIGVAGFQWEGLDLGNGPLEGKTFVAKLSPAGDALWSHAFGDRRANTYALSFTTGGALDLGGDFNGTMTFPGGTVLESDDETHDLFVSRFDANGQTSFAVSYGNDHFAEMNGFRVQSDGGRVFYAGISGTMDFGGGPVDSGHEGLGYGVVRVELDASGEHVSSAVVADKANEHILFASRGERDAVSLRGAIYQFGAEGSVGQTIETDTSYNATQIDRSEDALFVLSGSVDAFEIEGIPVDASTGYIARLCDAPGP